jgi:hypothetical protein
MMSHNRRSQHTIQLHNCRTDAFRGSICLKVIPDTDLTVSPSNNSQGCHQSDPKAFVQKIPAFHLPLHSYSMISNLSIKNIDVNIGIKDLYPSVRSGCNIFNHVQVPNKNRIPPDHPHCNQQTKVPLGSNKLILSIPFSYVTKTAIRQYCHMCRMAASRKSFVFI